MIAFVFLLVANTSSAIAVTEDLDPDEIIDRVIHVARHQWTKALVLAAMPTVAVGFIVWLGGLLLVKPGQTIGSLSGDAKQGFWAIVAMLAFPILAPVYIVGAPLLYFDMRCRTEGFHLETLRE